MGAVEGLRGAAMVTKGGSVEAVVAAGLADPPAGIPCTSATQFQLCSVSKQFTAAAVMLLVESGLLDLREPVARWLPEGLPQWRQVDLHQLLSHTAGVPHWHEAPGLGEFITSRILSPLKLTQTTVGGAPAAAARGYRNGQPVAPWDLSAMCTAHAALDDDDDGEPRLITTGYGYGMYTGIFAARAACYHTGDNPGFQSFACWISDRAASIVILVNYEATSVTGLLRQLLPAAVDD